MCGGGTQCGTPWSMMAYQSCRGASLLWWSEARASFSVSVVPPLAQSVMWCTSERAAVSRHARERAALIPGHQGQPLHGGGEPAGAAVGQDPAGGVQDDG